uniref:AlNc14C58G4351 protein n=1 Tax=Albugo laibachii Nc14 TaxID=890382 RepID=F0WCH3_9STRA|nr:AlNc14C58G4351 [Albugo laibachii Nc14]|eukprot:CCA18888.1 AlNc14C58G4351 [Albugo laibachii Nc14]
MGHFISFCGLRQPSNQNGASDVQLNKGKEASAIARSRSLSTNGYDMSIASILADVDHLIPDAFAPVDINIIGSHHGRSCNEVNSPQATEKGSSASH